MKSGWGAHGVHSEARTARAMTRLAHHQRMCFDPFSPVEHISCAQNKHTCAGCGGVRKEVRTLSGPGMLRGFMIAVTAARQPSAASRGPPSTSTPLLREFGLSRCEPAGFQTFRKLQPRQQELSSPVAALARRSWLLQFTGSPGRY